MQRASQSLTRSLLIVFEVGVLVFCVHTFSFMFPLILITLWPGHRNVFILLVFCNFVVVAVAVGRAAVKPPQLAQRCHHNTCSRCIANRPSRHQTDVKCLLLHAMQANELNCKSVYLHHRLLAYTNCECKRFDS